MTSLRWREAHPPRGLELAQMTAMVRVLAGRPRFGWQRQWPLVVFEVWISRDRVRWLLGCDEHIARHLPGELAAQVPGLTFTALSDSPRQSPVTARELRLPSVASPLRLDTAGAIAAGVFATRKRLGADEATVVQWLVGPSHTYTSQPVRFSPLEQLGFLPPHTPDGDQRQAWKTKTGEPIFGIRGRVGAVTGDAKRAAQLIGPVVSALTLAARGHARLTSSWQSSSTARLLWRVTGKRRTWSGIANAAELAALLAWPVEGVTAPGSETALSPPPRTLLVPGDKPERAEGDRIIGQATHPQAGGGLVRLPTTSATTHVHVVAPTGAGKSTLLANLVLADTAVGRSVFVLEPKGDLVADILARIPTERHDDVVVIEPHQDDRPVVGINPLAGDAADAERRADSLLGLFKAVFGNAIGPRSSDVLWHATLLAVRLPDGALTDVPALLTNSAFRRGALGKASDPLVLGPWAAGFEAYSEAERQRVVMPILNKLRAFTSRPAIRRMLGQPQPHFTLDALFREPKIVLVNLNAGLLGGETTKLLGSLILTQFWEAIQRQANVPEHERRPVMAVVDELPDFVGGLDFAEVLAKARGLKTSFTVAHQLLPQLSPTLRAAVLANCRSRLVFQPAKRDSAALAEVLGSDVTGEALMRLPAFHAAASLLVNNEPSPPFTIRTQPLGKPTSDAQALRRASAQRYGVDPGELDAAIEARWSGSDTPPEGPIGLVKRGQS